MSGLESALEAEQDTREKVKIKVKMPDGSEKKWELIPGRTIGQFKEEMLKRSSNVRVSPSRFKAVLIDAKGNESSLSESLPVNHLAIGNNSYVAIKDTYVNEAQPMVPFGPQVHLPVSEHIHPAQHHLSPARSHETTCAKLSSISCTKNPGHTQFFKIHEFTLDHLPQDFRSTQLAEIIRLKAQETVRLSIYWSSPERPSRYGVHRQRGTMQLRFGSGTAFVMDMPKTQPCTDRSCRYGSAPHQVSGIFKVMTVAHVVYDDEEARNTIIEFFLDDENSLETVVKAQGIRLSSVDEINHRSVLECITHDLTLYQKLQSFRQRKERLFSELESMTQRGRDAGSNNGTRLAVVISHPHGAAKRVSVGEIKSVKSVAPSVRVQDMSLIGCSYTYTAPTCPGSGGGAVNMFLSSGKCVGFAPHYGIPDKINNTSGLGWCNNLVFSL